MKLLLLSLGLLLRFGFACSCVACIVCWSPAIIHCEPSWIVSLLVLLVGLLFHWYRFCVCCYVSRMFSFCVAPLKRLVVVSLAHLYPVFRLQPLH